MARKTRNTFTQSLAKYLSQDPVEQAETFAAGMAVVIGAASRWSTQQVAAARIVADTLEVTAESLGDLSSALIDQHMDRRVSTAADADLDRLAAK